MFSPLNILKKAYNINTGGLSVDVQDQTTPPLDFFFVQIKGIPTTVAVKPNIGNTSITVDDASGCSAGDYFGVFNSENNRYFFGTILSITDDTATIDTPIDFAFEIGDTAACFTRDMDVNGSVIPQTFAVEIGSGATQSIDITSITISMECTTAVDLIKFGDLTKLTNGIVLRRVDGDTRNIWNAKSNGELKELCGSWLPVLASNPSQGLDGASFNYILAGQQNHGVAIRLNPGDRLELINSDDLSGLVKFRMVAHGHIVD